MARIMDKDTRLIDIDFGPISVASTRPAGAPDPTSYATGLNGVQQLLLEPTNVSGPGSFIQYQRIDLEFMTMNNEVMQPTEVSVQRTSPVPLGFHINGNNFDRIEEYIYVFTRPLNNEQIVNGLTAVADMRALGLDRTQVLTSTFGGQGTGIPTHEQTVYAEKRMYAYNESIMATQSNGEIVAEDPDYNTVAGMPALESVTTWGTMSAITGPSLYCYRFVFNLTQSFPGVITGLVNRGLAGDTSLTFPACNITFLCKDPKYTEGEYLTRLANAMNNLPEGGESQV